MLDVAILHRIFAFAVEIELIEKNPVRLDGRPGDNPEGGAQPFTGDELANFYRFLADHVPEQAVYLLDLGTIPAVAVKKPEAPSAARKP